MKKTAIAPANIAFVKYWGKRDDELRLPLNESLSMTLDAAYTTTTVEFSDVLKKDDVKFVGGKADGREIDRIVRHLDRIRKQAGITHKAKVRTKNSFPRGTGLASSASGFAALTVAGAAAAGLQMTEKELSVMARLGSGSAARSIPAGFVVWHRGTSSDTSFAESVFPPDYWDVCDVIAVVSENKKDIPTSGGMGLAATSPFLEARVAAVPRTMEHMLAAFGRRDFLQLGGYIESESYNLHAVMMTQQPPILYWNAVTVRILHAVADWRSKGIRVYATIDAGANVHLICLGSQADIVADLADRIPGVRRTISARATGGTRLTEDHLF